MPSAETTRRGSLKPWVRPAAVAGTFYPDDPAVLGLMVDELLDEARANLAATDELNAHATPPKAIIAPHAGYVYSGPIAASAYARLDPLRDRVNRVVLLGPAHHVPVTGLVASSAAAFNTPLGNVELSPDDMTELLATPGVMVDDEAHRREHSLEVHLPFLLRVFGLDRFRIVPLLLGQTPTRLVERVLETLWDAERTLVVVSSDLSHYHDYQTAQGLDRTTSIAIETLRSEDLSPEQACGCRAIQGLIQTAHRRELHAATVDLRNSGDTGGPRMRDQVVGYGAYVLS